MIPRLTCREGSGRPTADDINNNIIEEQRIDAERNHESNRRLKILSVCRLVTRSVEQGWVETDS